VLIATAISLACGIVDDQFRHLAHQSGAEMHRLAIDIDRHRGTG